MFASPIPPQEVGERGGDTVKRQEGQSSCNVDFPTQRDMKGPLGVKVPTLEELENRRIF